MRGCGRGRDTEATGYEALIHKPWDGGVISRPGESMSPNRVNVELVARSQLVRGTGHSPAPFSEGRV